MKTIPHQTDETRGQLLVVDDDLIQRTVIGKIAAKLGYDAVVASTFEIAANLLRQHRFDAMTLDLSLGEHDGVELLRIAAEQKLHAMPIIVISGCDQRILNSTRRVALGLGLSLSSCLSKPLNLDEVRSALSLRTEPRSRQRQASAAPEIRCDDILSGIRQKEFFVEFQPKVELRSGMVVGAEALARWKSPEFGVVSPSVFIPEAERLGLMPDLTHYLLSESIQQARGLIDNNPGFTVAVNVSNSLLSDLTLPERIEEILKQNEMSPRSIIVEVTESAAMADVAQAMDILVRLRIKGIGAAIDDFGTGYSSLAALARLPFNELKIDQSFVMGCCEDHDLMKIIEATVGLARGFKMKVVAEGIDNPQTLYKVQEAGCDIGQGYLFAPSLRSDGMQGWMNGRVTAASDPRAGVASTSSWLGRQERSA